MTYYVYLLCDPRYDNRPFYVGKGSGNRARTHLFETEQNAENLRKVLKIKKIRAAGLEPIIEYHATELGEVEAYALEAVLIRLYGRAKIDEGGILTNICIDNRPPNMKGRSLPPLTEAHKAKISATLTGRPGHPTSEANRKRLSDFNKANGIKPPAPNGPLSPETKANISKALTGRVNGPPSEETKQKIGAAQRGEKNHRYGKSWSAEQKQLRSDFAKANGIKPPVRSGPMSDEQKAAIARGNTGKKRTPEQSAHLSAIRKGKKRKPCSEETKEKIRQSNIITKAANKTA